MADVFKKMKRKFNDLFSEFEKDYSDEIEYGVPDRSRSFMSDFIYPDTDLLDNGKEFILRLDMPGLIKEDIKINIEEGKIEVMSEKKEEREEDDRYYSMERTYSGFYRSIVFPEQIVPEKASAKYQDGVLEIKAPKAEINKSQLSVE